MRFLWNCYHNILLLYKAYNEYFHFSLASIRFILFSKNRLEIFFICFWFTYLNLNLNTIEYQRLHIYPICSENDIKSPGYVVDIGWLSDIWKTFPEHQLHNSFEFCEITRLNRLYSTLKF